MKTKIIYSIVLLFLTVAFISKIPTAEEKNVTYLHPGSAIPDNKFIIGAMHSGYDFKDDYPNVKDTFHMNTWHKYTGPNWGWWKLDGDEVVPDMNDTISGDTIHYHQNIKDRIDQATRLGMRTIMDRPYIQYLAYGQRSDYQCEQEQHVNQDLWFYTYSNSVDNDSTINDEEDNSQFGEGQMVKHCTPSLSSAGYLVENLQANREQANKYWNSWTNDDTYKWYIKPRIRIDSNFAHNNQSDTVCRIDIIDWDGETVKKVGILGRHFLLNGYYDGSYLMEYNFDIQDTNLIIDPGERLCPGEAKKFGDWTVPIKTDYRVYWYGTCEMWIDYVRVENEPSVHLHSPEFIEPIQREVRWALRGYNANNPVPNNFYIDEFEFNITSSIKHLDSLVKNYSGNKLSLMVALNYDLYKLHIPNCWSVTLRKGYIKRCLIDETGINNLVFFSYPLEGWTQERWPPHKSFHPNTLSTSNYDSLSGILSYPSSPDEYDSWLQQKFDTGTGILAYSFILKLCDSLAKVSNNLRLLNIQQAHLWWAPTHKLKEPTNQEAEMMSCLAISYGAKGLMYFTYNGGNLFTDTVKYWRGLTNPGYELRTANVYGQLKAQKYAEMNEKYSKWGPYLMSFDDENRHSYIYRLENERYALLNSTYFLDVVTYKPGSGVPDCVEDNPGGDNPPGYTFDCNYDRYLQVALFDNPDDTFPYFMIINRRCSPFIDSTSQNNNGGRRFVRVLFDANRSEFSGYTNWNIIDLETEQSVLTFDKTSSNLLDLGYFMPGEGKLYKIIPVTE